MSCLLFSKLAPELRARFWEHTLAFETPLKHATGMKPFVEKFTASHDNRSSTTESTEVRDHTKDTEQRGFESELELVNTSLLTANKRIYLEAIKVFYNVNTIVFNPHLCTVIEDGTKWGALSISLPKKTDLELATHVVTRVGVLPETVSGKLDAGTKLAVLLIGGGIKSIFPRLKSATVFLYVDASTRPMPIMFSWNDVARKMQRSVEFDGVGSMQAVCRRHRPEIKIRVQHRMMMQHWEDCAASPEGLDPPKPADLGRFRPTADYMYRKIKEEPHHPVIDYGRDVIFSKVPGITRKGPPTFDYNGFEFWACAEWKLSHKDFETAEKTLKDDGQGNLAFTS